MPDEPLKGRNRTYTAQPHLVAMRSKSYVARVTQMTSRSRELTLRNMTHYDVTEDRAPLILRNDALCAFESTVAHLIDARICLVYPLETGEYEILSHAQMKATKV